MPKQELSGVISLDKPVAVLSKPQSVHVKGYLDIKWVMLSTSQSVHMENPWTLRRTLSDVLIKTLKASLPGEIGLGRHTPSTRAGSCHDHYYYHFYNED